MTIGKPALHTSTPLASQWMFKQGGLSSTSAYYPANDLPTEIHRDLLKNGKIQHPFQDLNELSVRWVGDASWTYRTSFTAPPDYGRPNVVTELKFEGLDTFATVYLNRELIVKSDNMFVEHRVNVSKSLEPSENVLEIVFDSAKKKGLEIVKEHSEHKFIVHQTEISRGPVRKAQYHWGWDWGPILLTCGPWKPISLETYTCCLSNLWVHYELSADLLSVKATASFEYIGPLSGWTITIFDNESENHVASRSLTIHQTETEQRVRAHFVLENVKLWWPRNYGPQSLYTVRVEARAEGISSPVHTVSSTIGFRKVELIQQPDIHGTSFFFRINNTEVFIGGSCWIPADSFLTQISHHEYRSWVELAAEGNQTMLRVWGGGIYEAGTFYDTADELGVLIWQDFAFACANYPAHDEYLKSVEEEARQSVRRLRNHPSIVIWAGNNEDYQIVERYGLEYNVDDKDPQSWLKTNFPARYIYEHLLPSIVKEDCYHIPYHPSSPFGDGKSSTLTVDSTIGDIHQWNVWHGTMEPYQKLPEMSGRFVSEFGMEAYPVISTLEKYISRGDDRAPGSMAMDFRNKAIGHERRLMSYVAENFSLRYDLQGFTHLSQITQADAMSWAYKAWRRQWGSAGNRKCGGVLVWQMNDCWPTMSWAVVDYHRVPKPAYHAIKRAMQPLTISIQRKYKSWTMRPADELWQRDTGHIDMREIWKVPRFDVWISNFRAEEVKGEFIIKCFSIRTGARLFEIQDSISINANGTTEILRDQSLLSDPGQDPNEPFDISQTDPYVVQVTLSIDRHCVATDTAWPDPVKYMSFEDRGIRISYSRDGASAHVVAAKPVKGFVFEEKQGVKLSDNGFDVMPDDPKEILVEGVEAMTLKHMYIGK